jgi:FkbM family methyltransferase
MSTTSNLENPTLLSNNSSPSVPVLYVKKVVSDQDMTLRAGEFFNLLQDTIVIKTDTDVYKEDGTPLLKFRKKIINSDLCDLVFKKLKKAGKVSNSNRGTAGGKFDVQKFLKTRPHIKEEDIKIQSGEFMIHHGKQKIANTTNSGVIGWLDAPNRMKPEDGKCRLTSFSSKHMEEYKSTFPFFKIIDDTFKQLEPEKYNNQLTRVKMSDARVADTVFTTITVNYNWRTALHTDSGDYSRGFGCFSVVENPGQISNSSKPRKSKKRKGENGEPSTQPPTIVADDPTHSPPSLFFQGCELMFPQYNVAVDVRHGDILLFDSHEWHCNAESVFHGERLSFVCYLRTEMLSACLGKTLENPIKQFKKFKLQYRPNTTDEKAMDEVAVKHVYKNKNFKPEEGDVWLDCGGQIGSFTMWALSLGVKRVITVEPHPENLKFLEQNTYINTFEDKVEIKKGAVVWEVPLVDDQKLWVTNTDENTYRHTIFQTRGRESIPVSFFSFESLLTPDITAVKMDIEGAEREILENCNDWKNVKKLVFEYHFTRKKDDSYSTFDKFHQIMNKLKTFGFEVVHKNIPLTGIPNYFPADTIVFCTRK